MRKLNILCVFSLKIDTHLSLNLSTGGRRHWDRTQDDGSDNQRCALRSPIDCAETLITFDPELLEKLPVASAAFNESPKSPCMSGTRVKILRDLRSDLMNDQFRCVWLKGSPGKGKSAVAKSLCIELRSDKIPVVSFFFNKDGSEAFTASTGRLACTIARQLARFSPEFSNELTSLNADRILCDDPEEQLEQLVIIPANNAIWSSRVVIVLDALDECGGQRGLDELMGLIPQLLRLPPAFAIFVSCRSVDIVEDFFKAVPAKHHSLDGIDATKDLQMFVGNSLVGISEKLGSAKWPPEVNRMDEFAEACGGLFEIASIRIRQVCNGGDNLSPIEVFNEILSCPRDLSPSLVKEYRRILESAYTNGLMSEERSRPDELAYHRYRQLLGVLITTGELMTPLALSSLVNIEVSEVRGSLKPLSPVMEIKGDNEPFRFYHASFREFLLSGGGSTAPISYPVSFDGLRHVETLDECLRNFRKSDYGKNMWTTHLEAITGEETLRVPAVLRSFLENDLIEWLESTKNQEASR